MPRGRRHASVAGSSLRPHPRWPGTGRLPMRRWPTASTWPRTSISVIKARTAPAQPPGRIGPRYSARRVEHESFQTRSSLSRLPALLLSGPRPSPMCFFDRRFKNVKKPLPGPCDDSAGHFSWPGIDLIYNVFRRRDMKPIRPSPANSRAMLPGSGTAATIPLSSKVTLEGELSV